MNWKIYYDNGNTIDSNSSTPQDVCSFGVACIVQKDEVCGRIILSGFDWYYYHTELNEWWAGDLHGLLDLLLHNKPITAVKQGRNCSNIVFKQLMRTAITDASFPVKTAIHSKESAGIKEVFNG